MIAKIIISLFMLWVTFTILYACVVFICGCFGLLFGRLSNRPTTLKGTLWVMCLLPWLILTEKGRKKVIKTLKGE